MNFEINKEILRLAISKIRSGLTSKPVNPIWGHFLFKMTNGILSIKSFNSNVGYEWSFYNDSFKDLEECCFTIGGQFLVGLLPALDSRMVTFEYNKDKNEITISSGAFKTVFASGCVEDFPKFEVPENCKEIILPENFADMLEGAFFSISLELKPDIHSLCLDINKEEPKKILVVATDRYKLSSAINDIDADFSERFLISRDNVQEIIKTNPTHLFYSDNKLYFKKENPLRESREKFILQTSLIAVKYVDIMGLIKASYSNLVVFSIKKLDFINLLKRIKTADEKAELKIKDNQLQITSESTSTAMKNDELVILNTSESNTEEYDMTINVDYLLEYLNYESKDTIHFKIIKDKFILFEKENYKFLLSSDKKKKK